MAAVVPLARAYSAGAPPKRNFPVILAAVIGGAVPDFTVVAMMAIGFAQQVPAEVIFGQWYFNEFWQRLGALTNSIPVYGLLALVMLASTRIAALNSARWHWVGAVTFVFAVSALLHCLTDLPLHHDDGRPHFWPLSDWVYQSPVSYWDPQHHGNVWSTIELLIVATLAIVLWRRYASTLARSLIVVTAASSLAVHGIWSLVF